MLFSGTPSWNGTSSTGGGTSGGISVTFGDNRYINEDEGYKKSEVDTKLNLKRNVADSYTKTQIDNSLNLKRNVADSYTKTEVDNGLNLKRDITDSYSRTQIDDSLNLKRNTADSYTKTEVDNSLNLKRNVADSYTKTEVDNSLNLKRDITDSYTKTEVDNSLNLKRDITDSYSKTEVDNSLNLKRDITDSYTKTEVDNLVGGGAPKQDRFQTVETGHIPTMADWSGNGFAITASTAFNTTDFASWKAFDGNDSTDWATNNTQTDYWIQVQCPSAIMCYKIDLRGRPSPSTEHPASWRFEGSNDNTSWDVLIPADSSVAINNSTQTINVTQNFDKTYSYFRLFCLTSTSGSTNPGLSTFQIYRQTFTILDLNLGVVNQSIDMGGNTITNISTINNNSSVVTKGYVDTRVTQTADGRMSFNDKIKLDGIPAIDAALYEPVICNWTGYQNPTTAGDIFPTGSFVGNATYIDYQNGARITDEASGQSGALQFNFTHFRNISASFYFRVANSTGDGADAVWFYAYCHERPTSEFGSGLTTRAGLIVFASEWRDRVGVLWSNIKSDGATVRNDVLNDADQTITYANIDNGDWHLFEINILNQRVWYQISTYNVSANTYTLIGQNFFTYDSGTWGDLDKTGTLMGFGARTGGADAAHFIRGAAVCGSTSAGYDFAATAYLERPQTEIA